jgi:hypothetical protein
MQLSPALVPSAPIFSHRTSGFLETKTQLRPALFFDTQVPESTHARSAAGVEVVDEEDEVEDEDTVIVFVVQSDAFLITKPGCSFSRKMYGDPGTQSFLLVLSVLPAAVGATPDSSSPAHVLSTVTSLFFCSFWSRIPSAKKLTAMQAQSTDSTAAAPIMA